MTCVACCDLCVRASISLFEDPQRTFSLLIRAVVELKRAKQQHKQRMEESSSLTASASAQDGGDSSSGGVAGNGADGPAAKAGAQAAGAALPTAQRAVPRARTGTGSSAASLGLGNGDRRPDATSAEPVSTGPASSTSRARGGSHGSYVMCVCSQVRRLVYLTVTHDLPSVVCKQRRRVGRGT